jgi:N-acetylmuramoyl-L-alanine amidase
MKFNWLLLSFLSVFLFSSPAEAGRLLFWRFDSGQNRLVFTTEQGVQPSAQLIFNPTRVVIDLPGTTLGRPSVTQPVGGLVTQVKVGQFDSYTTRLVIELANGYTVDPLQVKIQGVSPTQWVVNLPQPQRVAESTNPTPPPTTPPYENNDNNQSNNSYGQPSSLGNSPPLQVTKNGLFVDLQGRSGKKISAKRSNNRREMNFRIEGLSLPGDLASQSLDVNSYGVSTIAFKQKSKSPPTADVTLNITKDSPDWQASFSSQGGLVLWPKGGISAVSRISNPRVASNGDSTFTPSITAPARANIQSIDITDNQVLIRADSKINAQGNWNYRSEVYEIKITGAGLARNFRNPQLSSNSPIYRLRLWQPDADTVMVSLQPSQGVRFDQLNQVSNNLLTLQLRQFGRVASNQVVGYRAIPPAQNPVPLRTVPPVYVNNLDPIPNTGLFPNQKPPQNPPFSSPIPQRKRGKTLVVIDPGHGGKDSGAIGIGGIQEKGIILPISQQIAQILEQQGIQVQMTRSSDYFVTLQDRTKMANRMGADVFVSIHANSMGLSRPDVNGLETYYFGRGKALADVIHRNILQRLNVRDRRVRSARFYVLRTASMPAVLVETGYVTGAEDSRKLSDPNYRSQMAQAIALGILEYIKQNKL